jgi:hypothetical protein
MQLRKLSEKQREVLKTVFEIEDLPLDQELEEFLNSKGCKFYSCLGCGKSSYFTITMCEICYGKSAENLKDWILFRPTVEFRGKLNASNREL